MLIPTVIISVSTGDFQQVNMNRAMNMVKVGEAELGCARVGVFVQCIVDFVVCFILWVNRELAPLLVGR